MVMAKLFHLIIIASALFAIWLFWRSYADLIKKLGGTAQELHQLITSISKGDYSNLVPVTTNTENSALANLIKIQGKLLANEIERTQAALELQKTLTRFQAMFENHAIGIVVIDKSHKIEAFNRTSEVMFGYNKAEVLGRNVNILMPEPYHSEHNSFIEHYVNTGQKRVIGLSREVLGKHKNGTIFPIQIILSDASFGNEPFYIGFIEDIITKQLDGTITSWNLAAYALFGYRAEEMLGKSIYKLLPPDCYDEEEAIRAIVSQKKPVRQLETVRLHKDGRLLNVSITLSPIIDETGTVIGISKVVRDIHELKQSLIQIQTLAFYDSLTGLPNRRLLLERLKTPPI
jgi:PAS domain S-box-containing protein